MYKRQGSTWLSVQISIFVILILSATVFFYVKNTLDIKQKILRKSEKVLIACQVVDTIKYNERFHENAAYPTGAVELNGTKYNVSVNRTLTEIEGVKMKEVHCNIEGCDGEIFTLTTYIGAEK